MLTTGIGPAARSATRALDPFADRAGAAALAVELGSTWRERVPEPVVRACAEAGMPLVAFRRSVRFVEITEAVHGAVVNNQFELLRRGEEIHRRFTELILHGRGVPEILGELASAVGNPVVLEDAATSSSTTCPAARATTSRCPPGPTSTAPRTAARRRRARCWSTYG